MKSAAPEPTKHPAQGPDGRDRQSQCASTKPISSSASGSSTATRLATRTCWCSGRVSVGDFNTAAQIMVDQYLAGGGGGRGQVGPLERHGAAHAAPDTKGGPGALLGSHASGSCCSRQRNMQGLPQQRPAEGHMSAASPAELPQTAGIMNGPASDSARRSGNDRRAGQTGSSRGHRCAAFARAGPRVWPGVKRLSVFGQGILRHGAPREAGPQGCRLVASRQLYPRHASLLPEIIAPVSQGSENLVWCQEEPRNDGAFLYMEDVIRKQLGLPGFGTSAAKSSATPAPAPSTPTRTSRSG